MAAYATTTDLQTYGLPATVLAQIPAATQTALLEARSRWADGYLAAQFKLPLTDWEADLTQAVVAAVSYDFMVRLGYNPEAGGDPNIRFRFEDAKQWFEKVAAGTIHPQVTDSSSGATAGISTDRPEVDSGTSREWSNRGEADDPMPFQGD